MAIENQCARVIVSKSRNGVAAKYVHGGANGFDDEMFCGGFVFWRIKVDQCANHLTNEFMGGFNNRVCSRIVRQNVDSFDTGVIKRELKAVIFEFWTVVVNDFGWMCGYRDSQWFSKRRGKHCQLFWDLGVVQF